jgi:PAS domain S-box-containing protein
MKGQDVDLHVDSNRTDDRVKHLQRCVNDLVAVLALPAMWTGHEPSRVATTLLDVMVRMLDLTFAYLRAGNEPDGLIHEWMRSTEGLNAGGDDTSSIAVFRLGLHDAVGLFVAGSVRSDFPTDTERLLLQVATNQAAIALQEARHVRERRRTTEELERRVVERTAELIAVNEALSGEVLERRRAEERIRQDERELRLLVDFVPQNIGAVAPNGSILHMNRATLEYLGATLEQITHSEDFRAKIYHPDDLDAVRRATDRGSAGGAPWEMEARVRRHDGQYRSFLVRYEPLRDDEGGVIRWYVAGTDIEDRKRAEERIREENLALREEVDKASMFEEIVGVSAPLRAVLSQLSKVAPTESTVLITGETGTGKELVARAIHKRSQRSARAFVSVNCAAIPASLIASELFGHEKGAFTGAVQRRQGRFELADGGTIFLDEVGELPAETQMTLLRVLQEREFERVGGTKPIRTDVRVIAATNRDLQTAVADKTFRADLFYRLNVFPLEMPPLRDRQADIPLLVEYFTHRYAARAGKKIHGIGKQTLQLLVAYHWPGNIRELQNVVERAVIVSESETLSIDEQWLAAKPARATVTTPSNTLATYERKAIESALVESKGRVAGPFGAAARLGVPASTLESKIKALNIDKRSFKSR